VCLRLRLSLHIAFLLRCWFSMRWTASLHTDDVSPRHHVVSCIVLCTLVQAVFVVHRTRAAVMLADMEAASTVTVRLINYTPSDLHIRQLKSSTIGVWRHK
jgi:hypothetical protein